MKNYTNKDFEGTGWEFVPISDIPETDKLYSSAILQGNDEYLFDKINNKLVPTSIAKAFLKSKGILTPYDDYLENYLNTPFSQNLNKYFIELFNANDRISQQMKLRQLDREADAKSPGFWTFVGLPAMATALPIAAYEGAGMLATLARTHPDLVKQLISSTIGGEAVNETSKLFGYKDWGNFIYDPLKQKNNYKQLSEYAKFGLNFFNPGYLLSPNLLAKGMITVGNQLIKPTAYIKDMLHIHGPKPQYIRNLEFNIPKDSEYYKQLVNRYGLLTADVMIEEINSQGFRNYFGNDVGALNDFTIGRKVNDLIMGSVDGGRGALGGSSSIALTGTINRSSAIPHDLDYAAYIENASKVEPTAEDISRQLLLLFNNPQAIKNSPIVKRLQQITGRPVINISVNIPLKHTRFVSRAINKLIAPRQKNNAIYITPLINKSANNAITRTAQTQIDGVPIDLFMSDVRIPISSEGFQDASVALGFKQRWQRAKDLVDIQSYVPFSESNPIINLETGKTQYSPFRFKGTSLVTPEGYPIIQEIETYPGSGIKVPVTMNTKGEFRIMPQIEGKTYGLNLDLPMDEFVDFNEGLTYEDILMNYPKANIYDVLDITLNTGLPNASLNTSEQFFHGNFKPVPAQLFGVRLNGDILFLGDTKNLSKLRGKYIINNIEKPVGTVKLPPSTRNFVNDVLKRRVLEKDKDVFEKALHEPVYVKKLDDKTMGVYNTISKKAYVDPNYNELSSTMLHESIAHRTQSELVKGANEKLYLNILKFVNKAKDDTFHAASSKINEIRATAFECMKILHDKFLQSGNKSFTKWLNNNLDETKLSNTLKLVDSAYSLDYEDTYYGLSKDEQKEYLDAWKKALMYGFSLMGFGYFNNIDKNNNK